MSLSDPIGDMIARIKNAQSRNHKKVELPSSNFKNKIAFEKFPSLEAQIAAISDDIAYNNHDILDGIKAKIFSFNDLLELNFFKENHCLYCIMQISYISILVLH